MSCCYAKRMGGIVVTDVTPAPYVDDPEPTDLMGKVEKAAGGAEKIGMAFAVGAVLFQIFSGQKKGRKSRRRKR